MDKEKEALRENEADRDKIAGRNAVIEALKAGREIDRILVAKGCTGLGKLYALAKDAGVPVKETSPVKIDEIAAGANAITYTPPDNGVLLADIMTAHRERYR